MGRIPENLEGFREFLASKGLRDSTIRSKCKILRMLSKRVNLWDSEAVEKFIRDSEWVGKRKNTVSYAYKDWCGWKGFSYEFKQYEEEDQRLPYIPTERELDQLIAGFNNKYTCFLQLLKEFAFRPIEAVSLTPNDIDLEKRVVTLNTPAKRSKPRQFRMSRRLEAMIAPLIHKTKPNDKIWNLSSKSMSRTFCNRRRAITEKLGSPKLMKISFKTFRHWKATIEYHKTKDILYVKKLLGHKNIKNTLIYTHLVDFGEEDEFLSKVATNVEDAQKLIESGFEYVITFEDKMIFRKRK